MASPRASPFRDLPSVRDLRPGAAIILNIDVGPAREPSLGKRVKACWQKILAVRRVEKHDIEVARGCVAQIAEPISDLEVGALGAQLRDVGLKDARHVLVTLDESNLAGTSRQRLQAKRPASGEQVEAASPL